MVRRSLVGCRLNGPVLGGKVKSLRMLFFSLKEKVRAAKTGFSRKGNHDTGFTTYEYRRYGHPY